VLRSLDASDSASLIKNLEIIMNSDSNTTDDSLLRKIFQHPLFNTAVLGDCAFRGAVRKTARSFFEVKISHICTSWLESVAVVDLGDNLLASLAKFQRVMLPFQLFKYV
jgi:hypothetical protein